MLLGSSGVVRSSENPLKMIVKMLTHMHMVVYTWWCWHFCKGAGVLKKSSREVVSLAWAERLDDRRSGLGARTVRMSLIFLTRDVLGLWWDLRVKGGRSSHGVRTVCRSFEKMSRDIFASGGLHDVKGRRSAQGVRTVRPSTFSLSKDAASLSVSECLNGGRSAIGRGQSAEGSNGRL